MKPYITIAVFIILGVLFVKLASGAAPQAPFGQNVGTNSVILLPPRAVGEGFEDADATTLVPLTAVVNGQLLKVTNSAAYFVVTSTNGILGATVPTHTTGSAVNGAVTLRRIENGRRKGFGIVNTSAVAVWISVGHAAEIGKGIYLAPSGGAWVSDGVGCPQAYLSAIAGTQDTNLVTGIEW